MILYHAVTAYHLLELVVHKLRFHSDDNAILILPDFFIEKFPQKKFLLKSGLYSKILFINYSKIKYDPETLSDQLEKSGIIEEIDTNEITKYYIAGAQYAFTHWLIQKEIPFVFFEEASGTLTKNESLQGIVERIDKAQHEMACEQGLYDGRSDLIIQKYCNFRAQLPDFDDDKAINFDVVDEIAKLDSKDLHALMTLFNASSTLSFKNNSALILTQHFANLSMMSFEEQAALYQQTADYFLDGRNIVYKTHPEDLMFYEQITQGCEVIRDKFPSELLPYISLSPAKIIVAVSSTGIYNIADRYEQVMNFNVEYEKSFKKNHRYYFALKLADALSQKISSCEAIGFNNIQMEHMLRYGDAGTDCGIVKYSEQIPPAGNNTLYIFDDISKTDLTRDDICDLLKNMSGNDVALFLNTDDEFLFYSYDVKDLLLLHLVSKEIRVKVCGNPVYAGTHTERVFAFTKNVLLYKEIFQMKYEKELKNTGIIAEVSEPDKQDHRVAVLEGILEATEKRLLFYIGREKELTEKLKELEI